MNSICFSTAKDSHAFWNQELRPFSETASCFRKLWPEKNFWDYQTLPLAAQSAGTSGCEPQQCYPRSRLEQVILGSGFHRRQICLQRQCVVCKAETVRISPSATANVCRSSMSCKHSASACSSEHWGPGLAQWGMAAGRTGNYWQTLLSCTAWPFLQLWSWGLSRSCRVWTCLCLVLLTYHSSLWLNIFSSGHYVFLSRRMFVPWWKEPGLQWATGLAVALCLCLQPILGMWWESPGKNTGTGIRRRKFAGSLSI